MRKSGMSLPGRVSGTARSVRLDMRVSHFGKTVSELLLLLGGIEICMRTVNYMYGYMLFLNKMM